MKVLYDHQAFSMQRFGGVSKSFCELIGHFPKEVAYELSVVQTRNVHLEESGLAPALSHRLMDFPQFRRMLPVRGSGRIYSLLSRFPFFHTAEKANRGCSIQRLEEGDYDVFHPTFFDDYFLSHLHGKPFVLTVHDMMPELFFSKKDFQVIKKPRLVREATAIVAVSHKTKEDLIRLLDVSPDKVFVIHHGGPPREQISQEPVVTQKYLLYVGTRNSYKNFAVFARDYASVAKRHPDLYLVCTGSPFTRSERTLIHRLGVEDKVINLHPNEDALKNLYAHAFAFVYPSYYEGFGMPILEAYAYGCPVLLNHRSSFPEVAGDAALYFDSDRSSSNISMVLEDFLSYTPEERDALVQRGYNRLQLFSWVDSANKLTSVYEWAIAHYRY